MKQNKKIVKLELNYDDILSFECVKYLFEIQPNFNDIDYVLPPDILKLIMEFTQPIKTHLICIYETQQITFDHGDVYKGFHYRWWIGYVELKKNKNIVLVLKQTCMQGLQTKNELIFSNIIKTSGFGTAKMKIIFTNQCQYHIDFITKKVIVKSNNDG